MAIGDIGALLNTHTFDAVQGIDPSLIQILADLHCLAYEGDGDDGWSRSIKITALGIISEDASNTLEFNTDKGTRCHSCLRPPNIDCIAYRDVNNDGQLEAVIVASDGSISQHANHRSKFADATIMDFDIIHISGNVVAVVYRSGINTCRISTWNILDTGEVAAAYIQDFFIKAAEVLTPRIAHVGGTVYVVTYQLGTGEGNARSLNITNAGVISFTAYGEVQIEPSSLGDASLVKLKTGIFVTAHRGGGDDGWASVFEASGAGELSVPTNNIYEFDATNGEHPYAVRVSDDVFAVVYLGPGSDGFLKTIKCEVASAATWSTVGTHEFHDADITFPTITHRGGNTYIIAYGNTGGVGVMKTYGIESPIVGRAHHEMIMKIGP